MLSASNMRVFALALAFIGAAGFLYAQNGGNMALSLLSFEQNDAAVSPSSSDFGKFKLMIDNRFTASTPQPATGGNLIGELRIAPPSEGEQVKANIDFFAPLDSAQNAVVKSANRHSKSFPQTVTLSSSYANNAIGFIQPPSDGISGGGQSGRLRIFGSYDQQRLLAISNETEGSGISESLRGAVVADSTPKQDSAGGNAALASNYYVEASYNFRPSFTGTVSFKRSVVDTYDSKEELRIEGVVDTGENTQIKVGYNNEASPEVAVPKNSLKTSVRTEFILKF